MVDFLGPGAKRWGASPPPLKRVSRAPGADQTLNIDHFRTRGGGVFIIFNDRPVRKSEARPLCCGPGSWGCCRAASTGGPISAEVKGPRKLLRIRQDIFNFDPNLGLNLGRTKPKIPGTVPTDRHTTIPTDSGPICGVFRRRSETFKLCDSSAEPMWRASGNHPTHR